MQLDSANLPQQTQLNDLYGAWNPMSYIKGYDNQDLAAQFRDQAFANNQQTVRQSTLANDQAEQMNPLLLAQQDLINTGKGLNNSNQIITNQSQGLDLGNKQTLNPDKLDYEREKLRTELGDEKFNQMGTDILKNHLRLLAMGPNADPAELAKSGQALEFVNGSGAKVADRIQQRQLKELGVLGEQNVAQTHAQSARDVAGINADKSIEVGKIAAQRAIEVAKLNQTLGKQLAWINNQLAANPTDKNLQAMKADVERQLVETTPQYGGQIDLNTLANIPRNEQTKGGGKPGTADNPIQLK